MGISYIPPMATTFDAMAFKPWTPDQLRELLTLAEEKGVSQRQLCLEYAGLSPSMMTRLLKGERDMKDVHRAALSHAEARIKSKKEKAR